MGDKVDQLHAEIERGVAELVDGEESDAGSRSLPGSPATASWWQAVVTVCWKGTAALLP
jgi:hypothetical protein